MEERLIQDQERKARDEWTHHDELSRGNPVRILKGSDFKSNHKPSKYKAGRQKGKRDFLGDLDGLG